MGYYVEASGKGTTVLVDSEVVGPFNTQAEAQTYIDWKVVFRSPRCKPENYKVSFIADCNVVQHPRYRTLKMRKVRNGQEG